MADTNTVVVRYDGPGATLVLDGETLAAGETLTMTQERLDQVRRDRPDIFLHTEADLGFSPDHPPEDLPPPAPPEDPTPPPPVSAGVLPAGSARVSPPASVEAPPPPPTV